MLMLNAEHPYMSHIMPSDKANFVQTYSQCLTLRQVTANFAEIFFFIHNNLIIEYSNLG